MARYHYDLAIIGAGSAGLTAARIAHSLGARVLVIDKDRIGGDCLTHGCVPSKSLLYAAQVAQHVKEATRFGEESEHTAIDMGKVSAYIQAVIGRVAEEEKIYVKGVTVKFGACTFRSPTQLVINSEEITCRNVLIATGSQPALPDIAGLSAGDYFTNEDIFDLTHLPASLVVVGGGPVGTEMSQAFARLGTHVTIIQRAERLLPREDADSSAAIMQVFEAEGITVLTAAHVTQISQENGKKVVRVRQGAQETTIETEAILLATGRRPNVDGLKLEAAGVNYTEQGISVDEYLQTSSAHIYALGDVIGDYRFTHVATYQAGIAVRNALLTVARRKVDYRVVPWCTFTDPEVARVGATLDEARKQHKQSHELTIPLQAVDRAQTENETIGFIKLVLAGKKDEIVGAHIVAPHAGEIMAELTLAMQKHMTVSDIYNTIHIYPTMSTGVQQAAFEAYLESRSAASNRSLVKAVLRLRR